MVLTLHINSFLIPLISGIESTSAKGQIFVCFPPATRRCNAISLPSLESRWVFLRSFVDLKFWMKCESKQKRKTSWQCKRRNRQGNQRNKHKVEKNWRFYGQKRFGKSVENRKEEGSNKKNDKRARLNDSNIWKAGTVEVKQQKKSYFFNNGKGRVSWWLFVCLLFSSIIPDMTGGGIMVIRKRENELQKESGVIWIAVAFTVNQAHSRNEKL